MNIMKLLGLDRAYDITSYWGPRPEPPAALATRYLRTLESLSTINPAFGNWHFLDKEKATPLQGLGHAGVTRLVDANVMTADDGTPTPQMGYNMGADNGMAADNGIEPARFSVNLKISAGSRAMARYFINTVGLTLKPRDDEGARAIDLDLMTAAILAIVGAWNVTYAAGYPWAMLDHWPSASASEPHLRRPRFNMAWITYLSARFAPMVVPPPSAISRRTAEGGLLMIATEARFEITNPTHMAVAREIEAALAPVNALPWPPDPAPE
jgi:Immunity protein 52